MPLFGAAVVLVLYRYSSFGDGCLPLSDFLLTTVACFKSPGLNFVEFSIIRSISDRGLSV